LISPVNPYDREKLLPRKEYENNSKNKKNQVIKKMDNHGMSKNAQQWSNIKMARIYLNQIKKKLEAELKH
jgi:hypothetical protein